MKRLIFSLLTTVLLIGAVVMPSAPVTDPVYASNTSGTWQTDLTLEQQQATYYYYVGPWQWVTDASGQSFWSAPSNTVGLIDFRSLPQMGKPGGPPEGFGFFATTTQNAANGYLVATGTAASFDSGTLTLSNQVKTGIRNRLGLTETIAAGDLMNTIWELLTQRADVTGQTRWKPLMPDHLGNMRLILGGHSVVKQEKYDPAKHPQVMEAVRYGYAKIRNDDLMRGSEHHRRVLDALRLKYKVDWQTIAPPDTEGPLPHQTTITDTFNRTNADALGTSSQGTWSWTEVVSDTDIVGNLAQFAPASSGAQISARAEADLSSDDHYTQAIAHFGATNRAGVATRFQSDATTFYAFWARAAASTTYRLIKIVTGTETSLQSVSTTAAVTGSLLKFTTDGSDLNGLDDGASVITVTDTAITTNVRTGIMAQKPSAGSVEDVDDFEAGDLAAGGWTGIAKVNGVGEAAIGKVNGVAKAAIGKVSGVTP